MTRVLVTRVLLAAGGTGGHMFPAQATAEVLAKRGVEVAFATDRRGMRYADAFPMHEIASATPRGGSLVGKALAALSLARGTAAARTLIGRLRPDVVVGFGGYPTVPPLLAAATLRVPTMLHEQNAVLGSANRFVAGRAKKIALGFPEIDRLPAGLREKARHTGNPVRPAVLEAAALPFLPTDRFRVLVTGGSQGARVFADVVPAAIEAMGQAARTHLSLVQQARPEDVERVRSAYARLGVEADVSPFYPDLPARMAAAHLVVARAGASTVSELAVIGRASILVPFPHALDGDQAANATELSRTGAALIVPEADFTPERLAAELDAGWKHPESLTVRGLAAKKLGLGDAAERLADLVLEVAAGQNPKS